MIVRNLRIDRFGVFSGQELGGLSPQLNIFLGDNEAGKSTCRNFFRAMLFGYKRRGRNELDYSGASGQDAGGELGLQSGRGELFRLIRRPGRHGGELSLFDERERELPPDYWQTFLSGVTEELYDRVFAFDLSDLTTLESMGDSRVAAALHGAAFGTGFKSPTEVLARLDKEMGELFSPSGNAKNPAMNVILRRLQVIAGELAESGSEVQRHAALKEEQALLEARLAQTAERQRGLQARLDRLGNLVDAYPRWQEIRRLENELALHPHPGGTFGPESLARLEKLCTERDERLSLLEARRLELAGLEKWLDESAPDSLLLEHMPQIRALQQGRLSAASVLDSLPPLDAEIRALESELGRQLGALGQGWTLERAISFDLSIAVRDRLARYRQQLDSARLGLELAANERERLESELRQALQEERRLRAARGAGPAVATRTVPDEAGFGRVIPESAEGLVGEENARPTGLDYAAADEAAFGPEMRLLLEERWRQLEQAKDAQSSLTADLARMEQESRALEAANANLAERVAGLDHELLRRAAARQGESAASLPGASTNGGLTLLLREVSLFQQTLREVESLRQRLAETMLRRDSLVPSLFGVRPLSADKRRIVPLIISLLVFAVAAIAVFSNVSADSGASEAANIAANRGLAEVAYATYESGWLPLLKANWAGLCLALGALWSAWFWFSPGAALFGRHRPRPDALAVQAAELQEELSARERELERIASGICAWLPDEFAEIAGTGGVGRADALAVRLDALEELIFTLQRNQARAAELERQLEQGVARLRSLELQRAELERLSSAAGQAVQSALEGWGEALAPYDLGSGLNLDGALQIFDRAARAAALGESLRLASVKAAAAADELSGLESRWSVWLQQCGLSHGGSEELTPAAALDALALLDKIQERHAALEQRQSRRRALETELAAFRTALNELSGSLSASPVFSALCQECGIVPGQGRVQPHCAGGGAQGHEAECAGLALNGATSVSVNRQGIGLFAFFDRLCRIAEEAVAQNGLYQERSRDLHALQGRVAEAETGLRQCEAALSELFHLAGLPRAVLSGTQVAEKAERLPATAGLESASSALGSPTCLDDESSSEPHLTADGAGGMGVSELAELFRLRHGFFMAHEGLRLELERELMQLRQYAERLSPRWAGYAELAAELEKAAPEELAAGQEDLRSELAALSASMLGDSARQGEIKAMLADLEGGGAFAELRQEEAALKERLAELSRRWMVLSVARSSILRAKRSFEEDRQDLVVRQAGDFFSAMTAGAYRGLTFDLEGGRGGLKALALPASGSPLDAEHSLSRGTREQLYLALRLAYVRQHNQARESLPVIMDDILVNFDPARAALAASVLAGFAGQNQLFFFTCHPRLAEVLGERSETAGTACSTFKVANGCIS